MKHIKHGRKVCKHCPINIKEQMISTKLLAESVITNLHMINIFYTFTSDRALFKGAHVSSCNIPIFGNWSLMSATASHFKLSSFTGKLIISLGLNIQTNVWPAIQRPFFFFFLLVIHFLIWAPMFHAIPDKKNNNKKNISTKWHRYSCTL